MASADEALDIIRMTGDACVSAFFAGKKKKERNELCEALFPHVTEWYASGHDINKRGPITQAAAVLRSGENPIPPFHWEIEFPEVYSRANGGFDIFIGNPPFMGGRNISHNYGEVYLATLRELQHDISGGADLVAHFFRRSFSELRQFGALGLVATNTVSQGDTRSSGLRLICDEGGTIYNAVRRRKWPGQAAVIVSTVHVFKGKLAPPFILDEHEVSLITAYLFHRGGNNDPAKLGRQNESSYQGSITLGMGFTFDEVDNGTVNSIETMNDLLKNNPHNREKIYPYIGGEEVNSNPTHQHRRYAINFGELTEEEARQWPDLMKIIENRVKPDRLKKSKEVASWPWWQYWRTRNELYETISGMSRILLTNAQASPHLALVFYRTDVVFANSLNILVFDQWRDFSVLQSSVHEAWARFFSSSMKDDLRYNPTDCLETFPFPSTDWVENRTTDVFPELTNCGESYHVKRARLMVANNEGLTTTYNRFHDPHEKSPEIQKLRELHAAMDRAVLEAYGWDDLAQTATCESLLDYEEEEDEEGTSKKSRKKKPWRYRWPDPFRDEVLARLLELNEQRHQEELLAGKSTTEKPKSKTTKSKKATRKAKVKSPDLFQQETERQHRFVLLLLRAWEGKALTRRALNASMILILDDKLRNALLDSTSATSRKQVDDFGLNHIYTELSIKGDITIDGTRAQQLFQISPTAPSTDDAPQEDVDIVNAIKEYFHREMETEKVTLNEEVIDAEFDFVSS